VLCTSGSVAVMSTGDSVTVDAGQAAYVGQEDDFIRFVGDGVVFIASNGVGVGL